MIIKNRRNGSQNSTYGSVSGNNNVLCLVLISVSVSANADGISPSGHQLGDGLAENGFPENGATKNVSDGSVGGEPHL